MRIVASFVSTGLGVEPVGTEKRRIVGRRMELAEAGGFGREPRAVESLSMVRVQAGRRGGPSGGLLVGSVKRMLDPRLAVARGVRS